MQDRHTMGNFRDVFFNEEVLFSERPKRLMSLLDKPNARITKYSHTTQIGCTANQLRRQLMVVNCCSKLNQL